MGLFSFQKQSQAVFDLCNYFCSTKGTPMHLALRKCWMEVRASNRVRSCIMI